MLSPRPSEEPVEQPESVEGMAPADKPFDQYTDDEREAQHEHTRRVIERREREQAEAEREREAEGDKTDDQLLADTISALLQPGLKDAANQALVRQLHDLEGEEGDDS
jgi:hypothetical protein